MAWLLCLSKTNTVADVTASSGQPRRRRANSPLRTARRIVGNQRILEANNVTCPITTTTTTTTTTTSLGLPVGDINVLVVTDIHGWIAGQHARHEPELNFDFGDLVSLYERIQACADRGNVNGVVGDWFLLFNGYVGVYVTS